MKGVVVNGILKDIEYQICTKCISDSSCPGINFDKKGVCNFCLMHDKWEKIYPNNSQGDEILTDLIAKIKKDGKGKKYDCVIGVSGGRDSMYLLYLAKTKYKLNPLAVHFNDGFDNPIAGENMLKAMKVLNVDLRTITSNWKESKELKISFLKASTPELNEGTDVGIGAACYGVACKENIKHIMFGQSFRTEGIKPISWAYFEGKYLNSVQEKFGTVKLKAWKPDEPNYHLAPKHLFYYSVLKGIKLHAPLYYEQYNRKKAEEIIKEKLDWVYPGAHYFDDLYWSLISYVHRTKFNIDFRINSYSALIRDNQMERDFALEELKTPYRIEEEEIINLCIKRLGISRDEFNEYLKREPKTFRDYNTAHSTLTLLKPFIKIICKLGIIPELVYDKYFNCGE